MQYEVTITKKVEEVIIVKGCGNREEAMAAAIGQSKASNVSAICVKDIKPILK